MSYWTRACILVSPKIGVGQLCAAISSWYNKDNLTAAHFYKSVCDRRGASGLPQASH